jgi:hypothetical protein
MSESPVPEDTPDHLTPTVTDRGFRWLPSLPDTHGKNSARVLESSAATEPCIWLRLNWDGEDAVVHLNAERAWQLKEQIEWLLEHHYQGDARPENARSGVTLRQMGPECPHCDLPKDHEGECAAW